MLGAPCTPRDLCPPNAACIQRLCVCRPGFYALEDQCLEGRAPQVSVAPPVARIAGRMRKYGSNCGRFDDCGGGAECSEGKCRCPSKYVMIQGRCRIEALSKGISIAGADCSRGQICVGGSVCDYNTKTCICAAGHVHRWGVCRSKDALNLIPVGRACSNGDICDSGLQCIKGTCACGRGRDISDGYCRSANSDVRLWNGSGLQFSSKPQKDRPLAQNCPEDPGKCRLPHCFCSKTGKTPPGNLRIDEVPQFVVLTFDDAVNARTMTDYKKLFGAVRYRNPNGCPAKATFFVSHEWTNYDLVQWLSENGHEIASNSITHVSLQNMGKTRWLNEMDGQRRILAKFGNIAEEKIVGMRSPQTTLGGDGQFEMIQRAGFIYDNSVTAHPALHEAPFWPQTLDFKLAWPCSQVDCPNGTFPGVWEIPMNLFQGNYVSEEDTFRAAAMLRGAVELNASVAHLENLMMTNFERSYSANRAPFVLTLNADFLQLDDSTRGMDALTGFLDKVSKHRDVYFVTLQQLIEWMRHPIPLDQMTQANYLRCSNVGAPKSQTACRKPNKCMYRTPHLNSPERQFETCNLCPDYYPWVGNPLEQEAKEEVEDMFVDETQVIDEENTGSIAKEEERFSKRRPVGDGTAKPRAKKNNFVRLNMRKKMFVRGQMSASGKKTKESCG
ncbi:hypothetical protein QR680_019157 [Steinernema hermaphroditum]|uniref:EGF-like domain-containing protein n=1 Tax=Steinernema hermaphroditum TaxID=289476 RepID=A0AA39HLG4_9BILA|nr:hypothetical protein QR680_019157 [Steinernema hermaphroditum]